jgi:hypothetical protein
MNRFLDWLTDDNNEEEIVRVHVEHHIQDKSIRERLYIFMIGDLTTSEYARSPSRPVLCLLVVYDELLQVFGSGCFDSLLK